MKFIYLLLLIIKTETRRKNKLAYSIQRISWMDSRNRLVSRHFCDKTEFTLAHDHIDAFRTHLFLFSKNMCVALFWFQQKQ